MPINRRAFLSRMGLAGAGVATLAACNDSGSSGAAPATENVPDVLTYRATGRLQVSDTGRNLSFTVEDSNFPGDTAPLDAQFDIAVHGLMVDSMFWRHRVGERDYLMQWLRVPAEKAALTVDGQWLNSFGFQLTLSDGAFALSWSGQGALPNGFAGQDDLSEQPFQQGVAAGDPGANSLILWTRLASAQQVDWEVARTPDFAQLVAAGKTVVRSEADYTVKVVATGLEPDQTYYYRFQTASGAYSLVGRARTLPEASAQVEGLTFAVVSCASYPHGYFIGYRNIARRDEIDFVIHLGDYIYEYTEAQYGNDAVVAQGRTYASDNQVEIVTLQDYRARYRRYREDPDLQMLHARFAFITTWDDHETTDNSFDPDGRGAGGGAVNHSPATEGEWEIRKATGVRVYNEWMPIADIADPFDPQIHRSFVFGRLLELMMLDTRIGGRHQQPDIVHEDYHDANRRLLGPLQEAWLLERLGKAKGTRTWKMLGQQVMMAPFQGPPLLAEQPSSPPSGPVSPEWVNVLNTDGWDGYAASRQTLWDAIENQQIDNVVVLTGDIHTSWAMELQQPVLVNAAVLNTNPGIEPLVELQGPTYGVEFVTPSITSPGLEAVVPFETGITALEETLKLYNPHIHYSNLSERGYVVLEVTPTHCRASWYHLRDVTDSENDGEVLAARYRVRNGENSLQAEPFS